MTATLKHTTQGYVLIVDERPKEKEWCYDDYFSIVSFLEENGYGYAYDDDDCYKIIAAVNLKGVKTIRILLNKKTMFTKVGEYEKLFKKLIDTEVQATEHEEYWLVRL